MSVPRSDSISLHMTRIRSWSGRESSRTDLQPGPYRQSSRQPRSVPRQGKAREPIEFVDHRNFGETALTSTRAKLLKSVPVGLGDGILIHLARWSGGRQ